MKPKHFVYNLDEHRIANAIAHAERKSSGEIRVYVSHQKREEVYSAAQRRFLKLGMDKTRHQNAVLLYFAPVTHKFAIIGGEGIHQKCGQELWDEIVQQMTPLLKAGRFTEAIIYGVDRVGQVLAEHFPRDPDDRNELPDHVLRDPH